MAFAIVIHFKWIIFINHKLKKCKTTRTKYSNQIRVLKCVSKNTTLFEHIRTLIIHMETTLSSRIPVYFSFGSLTGNCGKPLPIHVTSDFASLLFKFKLDIHFVFGESATEIKYLLWTCLSIEANESRPSWEHLMMLRFNYYY